MGSRELFCSCREQGWVTGAAGLASRGAGHCRQVSAPSWPVRLRLAFSRTSIPPQFSPASPSSQENAASL